MFEDIHKIIAPFMTEEEALFVAATLAVMPRETALAMIDRIQAERKADEVAS